MRPASVSEDWWSSSGEALPQDQEPGRGPRPVRQHAQGGEEPGQPLDLVEHDQARQRPQRPQRIGQPRQVGLVLEIEPLNGALPG